jgi:hypothetical protein
MANGKVQEAIDSIGPVAHTESAACGHQMGHHADHHRDMEVPLWCVVVIVVVAALMCGSLLCCAIIFARRSQRGPETLDR